MADKAKTSKRSLGLSRTSTKKPRKDEGDSTRSHPQYKPVDRPCYSTEEPSSEEEVMSEGSRPLGNLRLTQENYTKLETYLNRIKPQIKSREILTGFLLGLMKKIDAKEQPPLPHVSTKPPSLPTGMKYQSDFLETYKGKALGYQRRLAILLATQYHNMIEIHTTAIDSVITAAEAEFNAIQDAKEKEKAIRLLHRQVDSAIRRSCQESRRFKTAKRTK